MLFWPGIVTFIGAMNSIHWKQTAQISHPLTLQFLKMREVLITWPWVINLVQEHNPNTGEIIWGITVTLWPVFTETTVLTQAVHQVPFVLGPPTLKVHRWTSVLFLVDCTLDQVHQVWCTTVHLFINVDRLVVIVRHYFFCFWCGQVYVDLASFVATWTTSLASRDLAPTGARAGASTRGVARGPWPPPWKLAGVYFLVHKIFVSWKLWILQYCLEHEPICVVLQLLYFRFRS